MPVGFSFCLNLSGSRKRVGLNTPLPPSTGTPPPNLIPPAKPRHATMAPAREANRKLGRPLSGPDAPPVSRRCRFGADGGGDHRHQAILKAGELVAVARHILRHAVAVADSPGPRRPVRHTVEPLLAAHGGESPRPDVQGSTSPESPPPPQIGNLALRRRSIMHLMRRDLVAPVERPI